MIKSRLSVLVQLQITVGFVQLAVYFLSSSIFLAILSNVLTLILAFLSASTYSKYFKASIFAFPHTWFFLCVSYLFGFVPLIHILYVEYTNRLFQGFDWLTNYGKVILISGIFLNFLFIASTMYILRKRIETPNSQDLDFSINWPFFVLALLYSIFGFALWLNQTGGISVLFMTRSAFRNSGLEYENGYLYSSLYFGFGAIIVLFLYGLNINNRRLISISFVLAALFMLPDLARGTRVNTLFAIVAWYCALVLNRDVNKRKLVLSRTTRILLLLVVPLLIVGPRLYRNEQRITGNSFFQIFNKKNFFDSIAGYDSAMDIGFSIFLNAKLQFQYGKTYAEGLLRPIPRSLWQDKPHEIDVYLNQEIFPKTSSSVGISFSGFSEPFLNFGILGIAFFGVFLGLISSWAFFKYRSGKIYFFLITLFLSAFSFNLLRGNLTSSYSQMVFPLAASFLVIRRHSTNQSSAS